MSNAEMRIKDLSRTTTVSNTGLLVYDDSSGTRGIYVGDLCDIMYDSLPDDLKNTPSNISNAEKSLSELKGNITNLQNRTSTLESSTSKNRTDILTANSNIANNANAITSLKSDVAILEKRVDTNESNISTANGNIATNTRNIKTLKEKLTNVETATSNNTDSVANIKAEMSQISGDITDVKADISNLKSDATSYAQELEVDSEGLVYLLNNGERIAGPYGPFAGSGGGGGGTGGNNATLTVTNSTGWLSTTIAEGGDCTISLTWSSTEDGMQTGDGTAKVIVNGIAKAILNIQQGLVNIKASDYLTAGSNAVKIVISDVYENSRTINFSINCIQISISSTFDATTPYTGQITFSYTPVGSVSKTIHFMLDGEEIGNTTTSISGRAMSYTIPQQSHGAHVFECYFDCTINGQTVTSNTLHYEIICIDPYSTTPIITSSFNETSVSQYTTLHVDYTIYDPANLKAPVEITVNGKTAASLTVDRTQQVFTYRADDVGDLKIVITSGSASREISLTVTESDIHVEAETDQLVMYLSSYGRSNNEEDPSVWKSGDISASLTNFNFTSDGWVNDDDGITVLRVAGDARVTIPYRPFASDFRSTGKTIEIEFATRDVMNYDATILSCMSGGRGIELSAQLAQLKSEQSTINMQYKEDEHVRLSFVVEKRSKNRLIYIYVNGIMSGAIQYPTSDDFAQASPVNISIGSNDCTMDIYCIRVYNNDLTSTQILNNWMADTQDVTQLLERYQRNSVYDEYGNIVIAQLPSELPYMIIEAEELPQYKGDKKTVKVSYVDPISSAKSFTAEGVEANVQGTSSQYYPRKNYKMKYKKGFDMTQSGTHVAKYSLTTGAIAVNTFTMKADVASSEGCNNTELVRLYNDTCTYKTPPQKSNSAVRQGIDGFPIAMFWNNGNNTTFIGKQNLLM